VLAGFMAMDNQTEGPRMADLDIYRAILQFFQLVEQTFKFACKREISAAVVKMAPLA